MHKGTRTGGASTWSEGGGRRWPAMRTGCAGGSRCGVLAGAGRGHTPPAGPQRRPHLPVQPDLHLCGDRPVPDRPDRLGRAAVPGTVRPRGCRLAHGGPPRELGAAAAPVALRRCGDRGRRHRHRAPALRMPGLFLAVSTLGFAYFMQQSVLPTTCWTLPVLHKTLCTGLPAGSQVIARPELFGLSLQSERAFASSRSASWCCPCSPSACGVTTAWPGGWWPCGTTRSPRRPWASRCCAPSSWPSACRGSWPVTPACASRSPPND